MDETTKFIKENPVKIISTMAVILVPIISGVVVIDDRYAHAADVAKTVSTVTSQLEVNRLTNEVGILHLRKLTLEDKVFDISVKNQEKRTKPTPLDSAIIQRHSNELSDLKEQISKKSELIDTLKSRQ